MKHVRIVSVAAIVLAIAACNRNNAETNPQASDIATTDAAAVPPPATAAGLMSGQDFANAMATGDAFEIESSRLAAIKAQAADIKSFAQQMVQAHTDSTAKLKQAATGASPAITPAAALKPDQQQQLDSLKNKTGADFDSAYAAAQVSAHQQTLDTLRNYSASGDVPTLRTFADQTIPVVTAHLNLAKGLKP